MGCNSHIPTMAMILLLPSNLQASTKPLLVANSLINLEEAFGVLGLAGSSKSTLWRPNFSLKAMMEN
jgi:hypothetical protein